MEGNIKYFRNSFRGLLITQIKERGVVARLTRGRFSIGKGYTGLISRLIARTGSDCSRCVEANVERHLFENGMEIEFQVDGK